MTNFPNGVRSYGDVLHGYGPLPGHPKGRVFFVDPAGQTGSASDGYGILNTQDRPLKTLQKAISLCRTDYGDRIRVYPGSHSVTEAVDFNKRGIVVERVDLGLTPEAAGERFMVNAGSSYTDGPAAIITQPCRIVGLGFAGRQTAGENLLIDCEEAGGFSGGFIEILNCRFPVWYGAMDALIRTIGGAVNRIVGCTFEGLFGGVGTAGIIMQNDVGGQAPAYTKVLSNFFEGLGSAKHCIKFATGGVPVAIRIGSNIVSPGFTNGSDALLLDNNSVVSDGIVYDNWLPFANKAASWSNTTNSLLNWVGNHYLD